MWLLALILLLVGAMMFALAVLIYRGKTELIHDYHQRKVTDSVGYGKAFGKAMSVVALALLVSGIVALWGESLVWVAILILFAGLAVGIFCICKVQRKYNKGLF